MSIQTKTHLTQLPQAILHGLKIFLLTQVMVVPYGMFCQVTPLSDATWQIVTSASDEFEGTSIDVSKWNVIDLWQGDCCNWGGNSRFRNANVSVSGGDLILRADGPLPGATPPYSFNECCNTGGVISQSNQYNYGFIEVRAKLPGFYAGTTPVGLKFWPALWTYFDIWAPCSLRVKDEIDFFEPDGFQYSNANFNGFGWWDEVGNGTCDAYKVKHVERVSNQPFFVDYRTFGVEWNVDRMIFYLDGIPIDETWWDPSLSDMHPMQLVMDLQIDGNVPDFHPNTPFPQFMRVAYIRYYNLAQECSSNVFIANQIDFTNYIFKVRNTLTIGNGGSAISLPSGYNGTLRAVNDITINGDFNVPNGCVLNLLPTPCN